jgi:putative ABC transport system permease protein
VATAICFIVAVGSTSSRYAAIMTEMNVFFGDEIVVVARNVIVIQGFPVGGAIPQSVVSEIEQINGIAKVVPMLFDLEFKTGGTASIIPVNITIGLPVKEWPSIIGYATLRPGGAMPPENSSDKIIVGHSLADQYGISTGSIITLEGHELNVSGIIEGPYALLARSIIISLETAQEVLRYQMQINMAIVEPMANVSHKELANAIESKISYVMALTENERNDLTKPITEIIESWNVAIQGVTLFLSMILVTILGMINVSERRRDFATLDAIGAPAACVFRIVLLEAALIGVLGGIVGIVFGSVAAMILATFYTSIPLSQFFSSIFEIVPPLYMLELFAIVIVVCCVGGIIPAINAARTRIADVLRAEY